MIILVQPRPLSARRSTPDNFTSPRLGHSPADRQGHAGRVPVCRASARSLTGWIILVSALAGATTCRRSSPQSPRGNRELRINYRTQRTPRGRASTPEHARCRACDIQLRDGAPGGHIPMDFDNSHKKSFIDQIFFYSLVIKTMGGSFANNQPLKAGNPCHTL